MRFSLRSLFVVLTLFGCLPGYVAYRLNWARQRVQFIETNDRIFFERSRQASQTPDTPWSLIITGQHSYASVYVTVPTIGVLPDGRDTPPDRSVARVKWLFPEAEIVAFP